MTKHLSISYILFLATAAVVLLLFLSKSNCKPLYTDTQRDTVTVINTVVLRDTVFILKKIKVKQAAKIIYVEVPADVDTAEILKKYFAHVFRDDTLKNDSNVFIRLQQEITENDVIKQTLEVHDFENTIVINKETTIKVPVNSPKFYMGAFTLFSGNKAYAGLKATFKTKKNIMISAGYGTQNTVFADAVIPINNLFTKKQTK